MAIFMRVRDSIEAINQAATRSAMRKSDRHGAGEGNRTLVSCLGSNSSTIELHPRERTDYPSIRLRGKDFGEPWLRYCGQMMNLCKSLRWTVHVQPACVDISMRMLRFGGSKRQAELRTYPSRSAPCSIATCLVFACVWYRQCCYSQQPARLWRIHRVESPVSATPEAMSACSRRESKSGPRRVSIDL